MIPQLGIFISMNMDQQSEFKTKTTVPSSIALLPEHLINQIKAGEVIESPSALLKEILENALDAGATEIKCEFSKDCLSYFSITDNGNGIASEELALAFERHSTSKLVHITDFQYLNSFGFRGEALASIKSVAQVWMRSKQKNKPAAIIEFIDGKQIHFHQEVNLELDIENGQDRGTTIIVQNLYATVPARLHFLKSQLVEKQKCLKILHGILLAHPHLKLSYKWEDEEIHIFSPNEDINRYKKIWKMNEDSIYIIEKEYDQYHLKLTIAHMGPTKTKTTTQNQFLSLNKRTFLNSKIHGILQSKIFPLGPYHISITCPSSDIDVNVHPAKTEIKFLEPGIIFSLIARAAEALPENLFKKSIDTAHQIPENENISTQKLSSSSLDTASVKQKNNFLYALPNFENNQYLLIKNATLNIFSLSKFCSLLFKNLLFETESAINLMPLMVALPLSKIKKMPSEYIKKLEHIFAIEYFSDDEILIHSIPENWNHLPYYFILQFYFLIEQQKISVDEVMGLVDSIKLKDLSISESLYCQEISQNCWDEIILKTFKH